MSNICDEESFPRNCYFGDGSRISGDEMDNIIEAYRKLEVVNPWREGDILILDNILISHARNPYEGNREILVAMGDMMKFSQVENNRG